MVNALRRLIPGLSGPSNPVLEIAKLLQNQQQPRIKAYKRYYDLLKMTDSLKQEGMESFVGNDPRTTWNMATYLLQPRPLIVKIVTQDGTVLTGEAMDTARMIEQYLIRVWIDIDQKDLLKGKQSWFWSFVGMLTATGGYALSYMADINGGMIVDYWNPASVFATFSSEGLQQLAKIRTITADQAYKSIQQENWGAPRNILKNSVVEYQVWRVSAERLIEEFNKS